MKKIILVVSMILCLFFEIVIAQTPNKYKEKDTNRVSVIKEFRVKGFDRKTAVVSGKLIDDSGNPIAGARIGVGFDDYVQLYSTTDSEGFFNAEIAKDFTRDSCILLSFSPFSPSVSDKFEKGEKITFFNPIKIVYKYDPGIKKIIRQDTVVIVEEKYNGREVLKTIQEQIKVSDTNIIILRTENVFSSKNKELENQKQEVAEKQKQLDKIFYNKIKTLQVKPSDESTIFEFMEKYPYGYENLTMGIMRISQVISANEILMYSSNGDVAYGKLMPSCVKRDFYQNTSYQIVAISDGIYEYITIDGFKNKVYSFKIYAIKSLQNY